MKTLMLFIALTASVWSSFTFAEQMTRVYGFSVRMGASSISSVKDPSELYTPCAIGNEGIYNSTEQRLCEIYFIVENLTITVNGQPLELSVCLNPDKIQYAPYSCLDTGAYLRFNSAATTATESSQTCKGLEGGYIEGFINSIQPFCATVGSTGGPDPQPLNCIATCSYGSGNTGSCAGGPSGNLYYVTPESCPSPTDPIPPDDGTDPGEPCTENCEPTDPETPPGGDDGSDIPGTGDGPTDGNTTVEGSVTDSQGNVTNINLTMDQDFSPITNRLNETNERLKTENKNSNAMNEWLKLINQNTVDGNLELKDINSHMKEGLSGIEGKLDGIKEGIDGIKDGMGTSEEGEAAAEGVSLPDYQRTIDNGFGDIIGAINSDDNNQKEDQLLNLDENLRAFSSVPALFDFAADNCQPVSFGNNISFDLCPYASTSSSILYWVFTVLTIIFLIQSISADVKKIRMS